MSARALWVQPPGGSPTCHAVQVADARVLLRLHGAAVVEAFAPPFTPDAPGPAALTVDVWAAPLPSTPPPEAGRRQDADGCLVAWEPHWVYGFDPVAARAFFVVPDATTLPTWSVAHPMLKLFHPWLRTRGVHAVHGAVVGVSGRALLLVGRGGSGKSTLAVSAALAGMDYLGDDYVAVRPADLRAFGLYRVAKLAPDHLAARVPQAAAHLLPVVEGLPKRLLHLPLTPAPGGLPLVGMVVPQVTGAPRSVATPLPPGRALMALAPSTLLQLPGFDVDFEVMASLSRALPAWHLPLGPDGSGALRALVALCGCP